MPVMDPISGGDYRTNRTAIAGIIEVDEVIVPNDAAMEPFIMVANQLVTECCTGTKGPTTPYGDARLEVIERWLAAHFYAQRDPRFTNEGADGVSAGYQSSVALGFDNTHYGQMAMRMDTNGGLAALNEDTKKGKVRIGATWLGTRYKNISQRVGD